MGKQYVVKGAYVTAQVSSDQGAVVLGFQRGALLPDGIDKATIDHLLSVDLITESGDDLDLFPAPADTSQLGVPTGEQEQAGKASAKGKSASAGTGSDKPAGNASQEDWATYAESQGMPTDEAKAASRDDLRDKYAG